MQHGSLGKKCSMPESRGLRFLADMGVSYRVAAWLRERNCDVVHLREQGLQRLPDQDIFKKAADENRIILTFDLDFGEIVALCRQTPVSVFIFRLHNTKTPFVIKRLEQILTADLPQPPCIVLIEDSRYRIRMLPL